VFVFYRVLPVDVVLKINTEKHEICQLTSILKDNKQELEFLKEHGSNNQLFLTLRKQIKYY
jgi:hypothetical protein